MDISKEYITAQGVKFICTMNGKKVGRAFLYLLWNELHDHPFGFMEDVFVDEAVRGKGYGKLLVQAIIDEARKQGCYKLIGTSRYARENVHQFYLDLGFKDYGKEFRMEF